MVLFLFAIIESEKRCEFMLYFLGAYPSLRIVWTLSPVLRLGASRYFQKQQQTLYSLIVYNTLFGYQNRAVATYYNHKYHTERT